MSLIQEHFTEAEVDVRTLGRFLQGLSDDDRVPAVRSLSRREQALLFDAAQGFSPIQLGDLVSPSAAPLAEVIFYGRNSLPVFRIFEKRFCLPPRDEAGGELWGYNEHGLRWATGPGYFVARDQPEGEVLIDYLEVPVAKPEEWPPIHPNSSLRGRFVYGGTQDIVRGVAPGIYVGRATRAGKPMDNWFVLCGKASSQES